MTTGEKSGTWGTITNTNLQQLEQAASGYISVDVAASDVALAISNGAVSNGKNLYYKLTGTLAANRTVPGAYTAVDGDQLLVDTSGGGISSSVTITLPASPAIGNEVHFIDSGNNFNSNNLTIARNGSNILGAASNLVVSVNSSAFTLVYVNATRGWIYKDKI